MRRENRAKRIVRVSFTCITKEAEYSHIRAIVIIATTIEPRVRSIRQVSVLQQFDPSLNKIKTIINTYHQSAKSQSVPNYLQGLIDNNLNYFNCKYFVIYVAC